MAFGIKRQELICWKKKVIRGEIAFITHYWFDPRFPQYKTVTKVGCGNIERLVHWGNTYQLKEKWIHHHLHYPHFDLLGEKQREIMIHEQLTDHIDRFHI